MHLSFFTKTMLISLRYAQNMLHFGLGCSSPLKTSPSNTYWWKLIQFYSFVSRFYCWRTSKLFCFPFLGVVWYFEGGRELSSTLSSGIIHCICIYLIYVNWHWKWSLGFVDLWSSYHCPSSYHPSLVSLGILLFYIFIKGSRIVLKVESLHIGV